MWLIRTKSGNELVAEGLALGTSEQGFVRASKVRKLRWAAGYQRPLLTDLAGREGMVTEEVMLCKDSIEMFTDKVPANAVVKPRASE